MTEEKPIIEMNNLSRWYGEVLGVNKVTATILPGITGLLGPNGAGKSTLMNLICGMLKPSHGYIKIFSEDVWDNRNIYYKLGYCTQYDNFYESMTGFEFLNSLITLRGYDKEYTKTLSEQSLIRLKLDHAMNKKISTYSKGMRQRLKVALALADNPEILVLDEPLNGLDAVGRKEMIDLIISYGKEKRNVIISSHILHEIEAMTDNILMLSHGYLLAEGDVREVRGLLRQHPHKIFLRCDAPRKLASILFAQDGISSVTLETDEEAIIIQTYDLDSFYNNLNIIVLEHKIHVDFVTIADENIQAVFKYLSETNHD